MALTTCTECNGTLSTTAQVCPHCGHQVVAATIPTPPPPAKKKRLGCLGVIGLLFCVGIVVAIMSDDKKPSSQGGGSALNKMVNGTNPTCKSDWKLCADNADLMNNFNGVSRVTVECKIAAQKLAKYGEPKFPWLSFGTFLTGNAYVKTGIVTAIEKEAQFQNGFGAWANSSVVCKYDLNSGKIVDVVISQK